LLGNKNEPDSLTLLVLKRESLHTLAIVESFSALQKAAEGNSENWITDIETLYAGGIQKQTLPTWILMIVLLIGFIILPAQVAEEKEKKLLLALLQTPIREVQWLIAKVIMGMVLTIIAILFLHLLGSFGVENLFDYIAFIVVGGFCFSAYGIFLGFLCRNQASARTLGVVFYLPHLLPSALSDFSQQLTAVAPLLPSYQFYEPLKSILLEDGRIANMSFEWVYLFLVGSFTFYLSYLLMRKRWLMR
jgi:ABC-2 type transport system permease protein